VLRKSVLRTESIEGLYETYLKGVENPTQADSPNLALQVLAIHSGGLVLGKSGDLAGQIALCMADGREYYEVSFDAAEEDAIHLPNASSEARPNGSCGAYEYGILHRSSAVYVRVASSDPKLCNNRNRIHIACCTGPASGSYRKSDFTGGSGQLFRKAAVASIGLRRRFAL
jgi:hypothetical protein